MFVDDKKAKQKFYKTGKGDEKRLKKDWKRILHHLCVLCILCGRNFWQHSQGWKLKNKGPKENS